MIQYTALGFLQADIGCLVCTNGIQNHTFQMYL